MMEQLAERRMQREEDTQYGIAAAHQSLHAGHNHGPLDEEYYDDEEDEDYDSQEEEDYEEDEMVCPGVVGPFSSSHLEGRCMLTEFYQDAMTEEQRMEEGRRMFQIFAARMFEQRVLTAYREKVAEQRQQKLIEELMEEETRNEQRSAKKAREAQKKKDKKRLQRQAKDEEKARREAEKAAEEAAAKAAQDKKLEDSRRKKEEQRKKREAERKVQEEERARKEAEKQRRLQEERDRQAEAERKHREKKEQEKKRREEARQKDKEEQESREQKAKEDQLRKKAERDAQTTKRASHPSIPSNLSQPQGPSPHSQATAPAVPKAPTPARPRQPSLQGSYASSPRSQQASTEPSQVSVSPRSMPPSQSSGASSATSKHGLAQHPMLPHPQPSTPLSPLGSSARSHPTGLFGINGLPSHPPGLSGMAPRPSMGPELPAYPPHSGSLMSPLRGFPAPNGVPMPPGMNGVRPMPPGRGFPLEPGHGLPFHSQQPMASAFSPHQGGLSQAHSRQPSSSFERSPLDNHDNHAQPMPISRPSPIKRPSSTAPQDQQRDNGRTGTQQDVEELSAHLGSSALLDDTDAPFASSMSQSLPGAGATAPGSFRPPNRASFGTPSYFADPLGGKLILQDFQNQITDNFTASKHPGFPLGPSGVGGNTWGAQLPFGASPFPGSSTWGSGPGE